MTVTNDFQPFAIGAGSNVVTPSTWASTTARQTGFQSGVANSALANTALRQANSITSMIAQFISDTLAQNVADNGNLATLETQFISAIQQSVGSPSQEAFWHFGRDVGPVNVMQVAAIPIVTGYADGIVLAVIPNFSNTTSNPTLSANGLAATVIVHGDGTALNAGDISINTIIIFAYDATLTKWRIISQSAIPQSALSHFGADVGTANAMVVATVNPPVAAVTTGMNFQIKKGASANTGATTLTIAGTTAAVTWGDGTAFAGGEWPASADGEVVYDGNYRMLSVPTAVTQASQVHSGIDGGTPNAITSSLTPAIASYTIGSIYNVKIAVGNSCTGASTANFNGLGVKSIIRADGTPTQSGDYIAGQELYLTYDGANIQITNYLGSHLPAQAAAVFNVGTSTFTPPAAVYVIKLIELWGGGGGGAGSNGQAGAGAGYCRAYNVPCIPGVGITVVVGAGGVAGVGATNGGNGGTSTFGASFTSTGGHGGLYATLTLNSTVGTGTGGAITVSGMPGAGAGAGFGNITPGGGAFSTSGSLCIGSGGPAYNGSFPGGGAAGGVSSNGGAGGDGLCLISY